MSARQIFGVGILAIFPIALAVHIVRTDGWGALLFVYGGTAVTFGLIILALWLILGNLPK